VRKLDVKQTVHSEVGGFAAVTTMLGNGIRWLLWSPFALIGWVARLVWSVVKWFFLGLVFVLFWAWTSDEDDLVVFDSNDSNRNETLRSTIRKAKASRKKRN
jgi:hypothetical protein